MLTSGSRRLERAEVLRRPKGVDHVPCSCARGAWRFRGERSLAWRPLADEVHRRDLLRGCEACDRRARDARLHGNLQGQTGLGPGNGYGCPSASIVTEELIQLGVKNLLRVGTCGGYSREL